eukprot:UN30426
MELYSNMILGNTFDNVFFDAQRQGRISFYMTNFGEEAAQIGTTEGLSNDDLLFVQYRELHCFIHRGVPLQQLADCNYSNKDDPNQGKQMPIHYGARQQNIVTISSTLATQMPQAAGAAYAYKREKKDRIVACFFGDGAASEGDAHAAFGFSAALKAPIVWCCRNNGFAISTPIKHQYAGDAIAGKCIGYGMGVIRVDGNDILAVIKAAQEARKYSIENQMPTLLELMTYRGGHHSTSDDSTRYRNSEEIVYWAKTNNPLLRMKKLLLNLEYLTEAEDKHLKESSREKVISVFRTAERKTKPSVN